MAIRKPQPATATRRRSLSMEIYAAMLGDEPSFEKAVPEVRPRLKLRVKLEAKLEHANSSPFHRTTLREHVERCAAYAAKAIDEARERLGAARPKPIKTLNETPGQVSLHPLTLVGPIATRPRKTPSSRAA